MNTLKVKKLRPEAHLPTRAYEHDAGADLYSLDYHLVAPNEGVKVSTGIACDIPVGYYAHIHTRSSMARKGWVVVGGICDSSYKGELFVMLRNLSNEPLPIFTGDRVAQLVLYPIATPQIVEVLDIGVSDRMDGALGSTGA